jgi:hypothetical protein
MQFSQDDRRALIDRVDRLVGDRGVSRASIATAVDEVLGSLRLPDESNAAETVLIAVSGESMPDLGSRVRQRLADAGVTPTDMAVATVGRHTVVTLRAPGVARAAILATASSLGARVVPIDGGVA